MVKVNTAAPAFSRRRARRGGGSGFGRSGHQMGRGGHRGGAEDEPRLLVESVGVGVAGVGAGDDLGGHRCHTLASHALECCIMFTLSSET